MNKQAQQGMFDFPDTSFEEGPDIIDGVGQSGFTKAISLLESMIDLGYEDIDIIIKLHEEFPKDMVSKVLEECRKRGVF